MTLYLSAIDAAPARQWASLEAPAIANTVGEFSVLARADGITQWTFRRKPLYRFEGDRKPGDVNGDGSGVGAGVGSRAGAQWRAALVVRYFMPADAAIRRTLELGTILSTASGATLYQRDRVTMEELHQFRTDHGSPALGRSLGTSTCDDKCTKDWPPFIAPADALPRGYWDIATRLDGRRQWVYKGFALYTYAADKPGETGGNGHYTLQAIDAAPPTGAAPIAGAEPHAPVSGAAAGAGLGAMFWHAVVP
jgi:predicted lipoprotein with Yx(FWY)xxD motif